MRQQVIVLHDVARHLAELAQVPRLVVHHNIARHRLGPATKHNPVNAMSPKCVVAQSKLAPTSVVMEQVVKCTTLWWVRVKLAVKFTCCGRTGSLCHQIPLQSATVATRSCWSSGVRSARRQKKQVAKRNEQNQSIRIVRFPPPRPPTTLPASPLDLPTCIR